MNDVIYEAHLEIKLKYKFSRWEVSHQSKLGFKNVCEQYHPILQEILGLHCLILETLCSH